MNPGVTPDFPNPGAAAYPVSLRTWLNLTNPGQGAPLPFQNPVSAFVPPGAIFPLDLRTWIQQTTALTQVQAPAPTALYDWPLIRLLPRLSDLSQWVQNLRSTLLLGASGGDKPPPVPPVVVTLVLRLGGTITAQVLTGPVGTIYITGPPQLYVTPNFDVEHPGQYEGLFIRQYAIGVDGNPWYRWDSDVLIDDRKTIPTNYNASWSA